MTNIPSNYELNEVFLKLRHTSGALNSFHVKVSLLADVMYGSAQFGRTTSTPIFIYR